MPKYRPMLGYPSTAEAALALSDEGLSTTEIAERLGDDLKATDVNSILRHAKRTNNHRVAKGRITIIPADAFRALAPQAHKRGVSVGDLIIKIIGHITEDGMVDAVLDDREATQ